MEDLARISQLTEEELAGLGEELARRARQNRNGRRAQQPDVRETICERCGRPLPRALIIGNPYQKMCECGRDAARAWRAIERIDPAGEMTFAGLVDPDSTVKDAAAKLQEIVGGARSRGVLMFGLPGRGKTHLSIAFARSMLERGKLCGVYNLAGLISRIQSTYGYEDAEESKASILDEVLRHDAIVLDDIGKEHRSQDTETIVYQLVDALYNARKPLIASSNLPGKEFAERYDAAVLSRLKGMCERLVIRGEDRREAAWEW